MSSSVILGGARTPIGKFGKALANVAAVDLGAGAIRAALGQTEVQTSEVDYVIMGQVIQAGAGQITARQAAIAAGIPKTVPALTINKVCLSGLSAIALADQLIRAGEIEVAVAGGMESMSQAPYLLRGGRWGMRIGNGEVIDSMVFDGLWSTFTRQTMGEASDEVNQTLGISREDQDSWAWRSHLRASNAVTSGKLAQEITPITIDDSSSISMDEGIRPTTSLEDLASLKPAFTTDGTLTVGNAAQISDGAAAVVVMSTDRAKAHGLRPLVEIVAHGMCADEFAYIHTVPAIALEIALKKVGMDAHDLDLLEVNEAFAAVALHSTRMLGVDESIVNVNGGSVALGHPIGATGARLALTLGKELKRRDVEVGAVAICGGGGQGDALVVRSVD